MVSPAAAHRAIASWLFLVAAMIFLMVILGGVTRLTHSGLSMVEWRPLLGWLPPLSDAAWEAAFARYREFPEYQKLNPDMTLAGFKSIFWLEYLHRLWGRLIGLAFFLPFLWFVVRRRVGRGLAPRLAAIFVLGGLQGALGWFMVRSGLVDRPDVSHYRLAAHLGLAFAVYGYVLWVALGLVRPRAAAAAGAGRGRVRRWTWAALALVSVTVISGALVAGLDAGFIYNTFPLMAGGLAPAEIFDLTPPLRNLVENPATVQFDHRVLAIVTLVVAAAPWWAARRAGATPGARRACGALALAAAAQVALGISTLVLVVPVPLAAAHQAGALLLFSAAIWALHELAAAEPAAAGGGRT